LRAYDAARCCLPLAAREVRPSGMSRSALVLAAHGSRREPAVNQLVQQHASELAGRGLFDVVEAAFNQGEPAYASVLDRLDADRVTVVPFMTSAGYFSDVVLPRELARNERFPRGSVRLTAPVGTHPLVVSLMAERVADLCRWNGLYSNDVTLAVIGHGTERHEQSSAATIRMASELSDRGVAGEVLHAFLDQEPRVESICQRASNPSIIVVPFLIGAGPHAMRDIPSRLGIPIRGAEALPVRACVGDRLVICDNAIGTLAGMVQVIEVLAGETL